MENNIVVIDNPWRSVQYENMPVGESFIIHEKGDEKFVYCKCSITKISGKEYRYVIEKPHKPTHIFTNKADVIERYDYWLPYFSLPSQMSNDDRARIAEKVVSIQVRKQMFISLIDMEGTKVILHGTVENKQKLIKDGKVKRLSRITFRCRDCDPTDQVIFEVKAIDLDKIDGAECFLVQLGKILWQSRD